MIINYSKEWCERLDSFLFKYKEKGFVSHAFLNDEERETCLHIAKHHSELMDSNDIQEVSDLSPYGRHFIEKGGFSKVRENRLSQRHKAISSREVGDEKNKLEFIKSKIWFLTIPYIVVDAILSAFTHKGLLSHIGYFF